MPGIRPILACGCAASAVRDDGTPSCPIHLTSELAPEQPDLTGRRAKCAYCSNTQPSDPERLAFFEFRGEGSRVATEDSYYCGCRGWD